jgi:hypothetical protein
MRLRVTLTWTAGCIGFGGGSIDPPAGFIATETVSTAVPFSTLAFATLADLVDCSAGNESLYGTVNSLALVVRPFPDLFLGIVTLKEPLWASPVDHIQEHGPFGLGELVATCEVVGPSGSVQVTSFAPVAGIYGRSLVGNAGIGQLVAVSVEVLGTGGAGILRRVDWTDSSGFWARAGFVRGNRLCYHGRVLR